MFILTFNQSKINLTTDKRGGHMERRRIQATKRDMVLNILKAYYLIKEIDESNPLWIRRINKQMKSPKSHLESQNRYAIKIISDKLL